MLHLAFAAKVFIEFAVVYVPANPSPPSAQCLSG
jgi:hypothetical protein